MTERFIKGTRIKDSKEVELTKNINLINKAYQDLFYQINEIFGKLKADVIREMTEKSDIITIEEAEDFIDRYMYPDIKIEDTLDGLPFKLICSYKFRDIEECE